MTLRTSLETSKKLKGAGIVMMCEHGWYWGDGIHGCPVIWPKDEYSSHYPFVGNAYSLDELLSHPRAHELGIGFVPMPSGQYEVNIVFGAPIEQHWFDDLQSALDFVAELLIEK